MQRRSLTTRRLFIHTGVFFGKSLVSFHSISYLPIFYYFSENDLQFLFVGAKDLVSEICKGSSPNFASNIKWI